MPDNYTFDPFKLEAWKRDVEAAAGELRISLGIFLGSTTNWWGFTDDFAKTAGPEWQKGLRDIEAMIGSVGDALYGLVGGRAQEQQRTQQTQADILDSIKEGQNATDSIEGGSSK